MDVDFQNKWGYSAFHESMLNHIDLELGELLLKHGADVNLRDAFGTTALHGAVMSSQETVVRFLLKHGANIHIKCNDGITPLDLSKHHIRIQALFQNHQKKEKLGLFCFCYYLCVCLLLQK